MKNLNLKILPAYRMYQAPEGGDEKPLRTSYLKDLPMGSPSRGGGVGLGGAGQNVSGQIMSGQKLSGQNMSPSLRLTSQGRTGRMVTLERAGSCPVVNLLHPSSQQPSDSRRVAKPPSQTPSSFFEVRCSLRSDSDRSDRLGVVDTVTDRHGSADVVTVDDLLFTGLIQTIHDSGETMDDDLIVTEELG